MKRDQLINRLYFIAMIIIALIMVFVFAFLADIGVIYKGSAQTAAHNVVRSTRTPKPTLVFTTPTATYTLRPIPTPSPKPTLTPVPYPAPTEKPTTLTHFNDSMNREESLDIVASMESIDRFSFHTVYLNDFLSFPVMKGLKRLYIYGGAWFPPDDISALATLKADKLEEMTISNTNISDISPISGLSSIKILQLYENDIADLSPIASLVNLEHLSLQYEPAEDFSAIAELPNLKTLTLISNADNIDTLTGAKSIEELWMNMDLKSIKGLKGLTNLKRLETRMTEIADISPLASLTNLEYIMIYTVATDITPISRLTKLKYLDIFCDGVKDITSLSNLKNAEYIYISCRYEDIDDADIEALKKALPNCDIHIHDRRD